MVSFRAVKAMGRDGNVPFCAEKLATLVEGVDI